jgi:hypothetical protein
MSIFSITSPLAAGRRRLTITLAATLAVALGGMTGLLSPAPAQAADFNYLMPAPGACGPAESNAYAAKADQAAAAACVANLARQKHGVSRLGPEGWGLGVLFYAGNFKGRDVMNCQTGDPHYACGRPMEYWFNRYGAGRYCASGWWESIYKGWGHPYNTAREAVRGWLNSDKGHREALLNPAYTKHGMGLSSMGTYQGNPNAVVFVHYLCV